MKKRFIISLFFFSFSLLFFAFHADAQEQSIDEFFSQIQKSLKRKDISSYLDNFSVDIRDKEESIIREKVDLNLLDRVDFFRLDSDEDGKDGARIYLQVLFQNDFSVSIERWNFALSRKNGRWKITEKKLIGDTKDLYRVKIPSERIEKVKSIEVEHADIKLIFKNSILFYDNIPGLETALLILGRGHLYYAPSSPREEHQLELLYKKKFLEDRLEYAYLRFSTEFFRDHIKIESIRNPQLFRVTQLEINKAKSLFSKHYPRSFTIENSLTGELLSFMPRENEAVLAFKGKRAGIFTYIYSPFSSEEVNLYRWKDHNIVNLYTPVIKGIKVKAFVSLSQMFDIKNYWVDIDYDPKQSYLSGKARITIHSKVGFLDVVKLRFNPELDILRIQDEKKRSLFYTRDKLRKILYVYLVDFPSLDESQSIEVIYRGKIIPPQQTADMIRGPQFKGKLKDLTPKIETYFFSQSALWYPSPPDEDYFDARLKIIIPPEYTCVSNGELIEQTRLDKVERVEDIDKVGCSVFVFETKHPIKYISFLVGKLTKIQEDTKPVPIQVFRSSGIFSHKKEFFQEAKNILRFYVERFGPYPYEKLSIIRRFWSETGGHSPASFIILNELPRMSEDRRQKSMSPVDLSRWKEYFLAHEIAHQWWGHGVTWKSYHDLWLAEGLAQFSAILYLREKHGDRVFSHILKNFSKWTRKKSRWGQITLGSRLSYFDFKAFQSIIYNKASLALNMLRDYLGEDVFFKGLKEFYLRNKYRASNTDEFLQIVEEVSGKDLKVFFMNWFDSHLLPEVKVSHSIQMSKDGYNLTFRINQLKKVFPFPLWVEWNSNGEKIRKKLIIDEKDEEFEFVLRFKPEKIKINPSEAVPGKFF